MLALAFGLTGLAGDLDEIRTTQQKLIAARDPDKPPRDEVPMEAVALVKRQLLHWIEARLKDLGPGVSPAELTKILEEDLKKAILRSPHGDDSDLLGELDLAFTRPKGAPTWLQLNTDVGIQCGVDRSFYLYQWSDNRWKRRFAMQANDDSLDHYDPKQAVELQVSLPDSRGARLVLATGWPPACISVWHTLYIQLFRLDSAQKLLLDERPLANLGQEGPAYSTRLEPNGALVEFYGSSIDAGLLIRKHIVHYLADGDKAKRVEPIALTPTGFVEEWLTRPWTEIAPWSEPQLAEWHQKLHKDYVSGEYDTLRRCAEAGQWQVSINFSDDQNTYFSVLDGGDKRFRMLNVSEKPRPDCSGPNELQ